MKLQYEFATAGSTMIDFPPLPTRRRYRAYLEMLGAVR